MNIFMNGLLRYLSEEQLRLLSKIKVGIAGAGGLGSNAAVCLVRSGINRLKIVDFDTVDASNLNRQFYFWDQVGQSKVTALKENLLRINPAAEIEAVDRRLDADNMGIFRDCGVIVEAFDKADLKRMLFERYYASGKLLVLASGIGGIGESDRIVTRKVRDNVYIVGDSVTEADENHPPFAPRVLIAAAKQADLVLEFVLSGLEEGGFSDVRF